MSSAHLTIDQALFTWNILLSAVIYMLIMYLVMFYEDRKHLRRHQK